MDNREERSFRPGSVVGGLMLLALGGAMLLDTTGLMEVRFGHLVAPVILIALGVTILLDRGAFIAVAGRTEPHEQRRRRYGRRRTPFGGLWLIGIGVWMMISEMHLFGLTFHTSWPLMIVLAGLLMVLRAVIPTGAYASDPTRNED